MDGGDWQPYDGPFTIEGAGAHQVSYRATDNAGNVSAVATGTVTVATPPDCAPATPAAGYRTIFDGTQASLAGWSQAGPGGFDPNPDCTIDAWGGMGLLWYSAEELTSPYTVRAEWKIYSDDDNSGIFLGFPDPGDDPWLPVSQGYEIQIDPTDEAVRTTGAVYGFQAPDEQARAEALNPHGEWNVLEVAVDAPQITIRLNGVVINEYTSPHPERDLATGFIGIQNDGAGRDVTYRSVQIKEDAPAPDDGTAPTVEASLAGATDGTGRYTGPVQVSITAAEEQGGSGVGMVEYRLDGGNWVAYTQPFQVVVPGEHTVAFRATDVAGNVSAEGSMAFGIAEGGEGSFDELLALVGDYNENGTVSDKTTANLMYSLNRAVAAADTGSEKRTLLYLGQFLARAENQVKGNAADLAARALFVAEAERLLAHYQAIEDAENAER